MRRPAPSLVISLIALFVAIGGPAQAVNLLNGNRIKAGTIKSKQIANGTIQVKDVAKAARARFTTTRPNSILETHLTAGAVSSSHVADKALAGADLADGTIGALQIADGSIDSSEVLDGRLTARDVGGFLGRGELDFGEIEANACKKATMQLQEVPPTGPTPRDVRDDIIVVTPEPGLALEAGLVLAGARAENATGAGVTLCNVTAAGLMVGRRMFRYLTLDTDG